MKWNNSFLLVIRLVLPTLHFSYFHHKYVVVVKIGEFGRDTQKHPFVSIDFHISCSLPGIKLNPELLYFFLGASCTNLDVQLFD